MARDIRTLLHEAAPIRPPARTFDEVWRRSRALRVQKMVASGVATIAVAVIATLVVAGAGNLSSTVPPADDSPNRKGQLEFDVGGFPYHLAIGDGSLWVAVNEDTGQQEASFVKRIDPSTNEIIAEIPIDQIPDAMAATSDSVWMVFDHVGERPARPLVGSIYRIDTESNKVTAGPIDFEGRPGFEIVAGTESVWVTTAGRGLVRIDPVTAHVMATLPIRSPNVALQGDRVWVATKAHGLFELDLGTNRVIKPAIADANVAEMVADPEFIWASQIVAGERVVRIDPNVTPPGREVVETDLYVGNLVIDGPYLWALQFPRPRTDPDEHGVIRIDRQSASVIGEPIPTRREAHEMTVGFGSVWVGGFPDTVIKIAID